MLASLGKLADGGPAERLLLSEVLPVAEELAADLRAHPASDAVEVAGSARRRTETCKDIDLIATASDPAALAQALAEHPLAATTGSAGDGGARITTHNGIAVDLRIVAPDAYGNLLQHFTGSAEHNVELRERAVGDGPLGLRARDHRHRDRRGRPLRDRGRGLRAPRARLHRARAARGQRRDRGRGRRATLPELVELDDIRGDLHCHTTLSDGRNTLEEMAEAARARGYAYLAITDHSASHGFGNHVTAEAARGADRGGAGAATRAGAASALLAGSEVNILPDGSLDYDGRPAGRARLGDRQRPHLVSRSPASR